MNAGTHSAVVLNRDTSAILCERCVVADRPVSRLRGLLGRDGLAAEEGLLLRPAAAIHTCFMRFPIDAVFVGRPDPARSGARPVLSIHPTLRAWTGLVPFVRGAKGVLELPAGTIAETGTAVGDLIALEPLTGE